MDNDVICSEIKIDKSILRQIIKEELYNLIPDIANKIPNSNVVDNNDKSITRSIKYSLKMENKEIDTDNDSIRCLINNLVNKNSQFFDKGDENMSIKEFIVKIVDKLVELTNIYRVEIENRKKENKDLNDKIDICDCNIERLKKELNDEKSNLSTLVDEKNKLEKKCDGLNYDKSKLTDQVEKLEIELNNTCREVKQIFKSIQKIDSKYIDELKPYIRLNKLEPFIVSSAINIDALDKIWRVAKLAAKNNEPETREIIRKYFEYMVELFNEAKNEKVVIIDDVNEGDFYNIHDFECIDSNKSYGGIVSKVYLPGFINNYNNKRIEKSLVDIKEN
ncbi:hypothetical protein [uncultured Veillonella sp.]|uniref:hypothetical protein n=1 Tax=uncultured Veillonella sp. TaxID=159268 RepID=UPI0025ED3F86|nr:hypothetical protein [uncultured Veillonella sp.]